jgi:hypothetical protein
MRRTRPPAQPSRLHGPAVSNTKCGFGRIRKKQEVRTFFDGLDLVEPGLVNITGWLPDGRDEEQSQRWGLFVGIGRKPA